MDELRRLKIAGVVIAVAGMTFAGVAAQGAKPKAPPDAKEQLAKASKKDLGPTTFVMAVWRNNEFHVIKVPAQRTASLAADGSIIGETETVGPEAVPIGDAQLPPLNPKIVVRNPTDAEKAANDRVMAAETVKVNGLPPNGPPPGSP